MAGCCQATILCPTRWLATMARGANPDKSDPGDWVTTADTNTSEFSGCTVENSSWHGTRVAGILGAITNNATGVGGLDVEQLSDSPPCARLGKCGGNDSDIEAAMLWAAGIHVDGVPDNPYPAKIENLSIGAAGQLHAGLSGSHRSSYRARRAGRRVRGQRGRPGRHSRQLPGRRWHRGAAPCGHQSRLQQCWPRGRT